MTTANTLEDLHRFFEDDPNDHQLEIQAETRLKALYACLMNTNSRTMLQIGLTGLLTYVKASSRSPIIDELLLAKDYISEIISMAADHFSQAPLLSANCLYECMLNYPKKFSPFLINKFRPMLPRIIFKKTSGPNDICCKSIAQLSILGTPSSSKQAKAWKTEFDRYLKIACLLIDQLYSGINDRMCPDVNDLETALTSEIGDLVSPTDYAAIFANCCHILRYLFYVQLESTVSVPAERTFQLIRKVISINHQQFNLLHRKQHLAVILDPTIQLFDALVAFNPSSFTFHTRSMFNSIITLFDHVRSQVEYLTFSISIYRLLTNFFALFHRQVRLDADVLPKLIRWFIHDTTIRVKAKIPVNSPTRPDPLVTRAALQCVQQLLNIYSDHLPKDQYDSMQNHFLQTLITCQATMSSLNKPFDDELCRLGLYQILECFLLNERADCSTLLAISKDLIDAAINLDASIQVKMAVRKLKLVWQQVHDSSSHLYQPWSLINVDKPRKTTYPSHIIDHHHHSHLHQQPQIFLQPELLMTNNIPTAPTTSITTTTTTIEAAPVNTYLPPPTTTLPYNNAVEVPPLTIEHREEMDRSLEEDQQQQQQQRKRAKVIDTRPVAIDDDDDDDGAEQIFADDDETMEDDEGEEEDEEEIDDGEEMDESDEVDDEEERIDEETDLTSTEDDEREPLRHSNGLQKLNQHLALHQSNVDLLSSDVQTAGDEYLQTMNENLHKKFRRVNPHYPSIHPGISEDFAHLLPHPHAMADPHQLNGDYKSNLSKPMFGNGQGLAANVPSKNNNDDDEVDDDDDDIVLVSDDDSVEKPTKKTFDHLAPSGPPKTYPDQVIGHSSAVLTMHEAISSKDFVENLERPPVEKTNHLQSLTADDSFDIAIQETVESIRDTISLLHDVDDERK